MIENPVVVLNWLGLSHRQSNITLTDRKELWQVFLSQSNGKSARMNHLQILAADLGELPWVLSTPSKYVDLMSIISDTLNSKTNWHHSFGLVLAITDRR